MIRHTIAALTVGALVAAAGVAPPAGQLFAQADDEQPPAEEEVVALAAAQLKLGERFSTPLWDLEAQSIFRAPHPRMAEKTEVRIAVAMRNQLTVSMTLNDSSFVSHPGFPRLVLVDAAGIERPLRSVRMRHTTVGQYDLRDLPPGMTARWTVGFQVPTDIADDLELVARDPQGADLVVWDLEDRGMRAGWSPPSDAEPLAFGETIPWDDAGVEVTAIEHGSLVCGNPNVEYVTHVFAVRFEVGNRNFADDLAWPGITFPDTAAIAQWSDGSAAAVTSETFAGPDALLRKVFTDQIELPATEDLAGEVSSFPRALLFGVPRDGRLGSVADSPDGVLLNLRDGTRRWLDITGPATLEMNPALCDVGFFEFTIPYAFAPSHDFDVARVRPAEDPAAQDRAAREILTQALVSASVYHQNNGSYRGVTSAALEAIWAGIDFTNAEARAQPGVVAWEVPVEDIDRQQIILVTRSASGLYLCAVNEALSTTRFGEADDLQGILAACEPTLPAVEEPTATDTDTTTTTTTTTVAP